VLRAGSGAVASDIAAYRSIFSSRPGGQAAISGGKGYLSPDIGRLLPTTRR